MTDILAQDHTVSFGDGWDLDLTLISSTVLVQNASPGSLSGFSAFEKDSPYVSFKPQHVSFKYI